MNLEQLTKTQTILLTLLVSFVTSIATGIVTVTLVSEAPPAVTQTINRVVEHTVERVVPSEGEQAAAAEVVTKEVQVLVKESDLITDAVAKVNKSLVRIYSKSGAAGIEPAFLGVGVIISREGHIATSQQVLTSGVSYAVRLQNGNEYTATIVQDAGDSPIKILAIDKPTEETEAPATVFLPVALANLSEFKLGESVLTLGGKDRTNVATGIVSDFVLASEGIAGSIMTTIATTPTAGSPLVNLLGEVAGVYAGSEAGGVAYAPNTQIKDQLAQLLGE